MSKSQNPNVSIIDILNLKFICILVLENWDLKGSSQASREKNSIT
jgi:hypothetical protein